MKNLKKLGKGIWQLLLMPADDCGLFPIVARIGLYGFLLFGILLIQSASFDASKLLTVVSFSSIVTIIEIMWRKSEVGKRLIWHLAALIILIGFLGLLLNQAVIVREAWYRTHVLEDRIQGLIATSPAAVIVSDGLGNIKYINQNATALIGWRNEEIAGKPISILMRPHKVEGHNKAFRQEANELKQGTARWIYTGNRIFRIVCKPGNLIKTQIYLVGIRYSSDLEPGLYPKGQDIEFYAIIQPTAPLIDPEEAVLDASIKLEQAKQEEKADRREAIKAEGMIK